MSDLLVESARGVSSRALVHLSEPALGAPRAVVVVVPAMGVPAAFYGPLAEKVASSGLAVVVSELRGIGSSSVRAGRDVDFGYEELATDDLPAVIDAARARFPDVPVLLLGHSLGGHVALLAVAERPDLARAVALVASGTPYFRNWPFPASSGMRALAHAARGVSSGVGHFPGRSLGFAGREAKRLMHEWAGFVLKGRLAVRGADRLGEVRLPVMALSIDGDRFAPARAVDHLVGLVPGAALTRVHVEGGELDHFRWVRKPDAVVRRLAPWLEEVTS